MTNKPAMKPLPKDVGRAAPASTPVLGTEWNYVWERSLIPSRREPSFINACTSEIDELAASPLRECSVHPAQILHHVFARLSQWNSNGDWILFLSSCQV